MAEPACKWVTTFFNENEQHCVENLTNVERRHLERLLCGKKRKRNAGTSRPIRVRVLQSSLPEEVRITMFNTLRQCATPKYVEWVNKMLRVPYGISFSPHMHRNSAAVAIQRATEVLDAAVAGHAEAKRHVLKLVCQAHSGGTGVAGYALGLEGPPGTGKTHFARNALAPALGRPFVSIALGGASDASYLMGHNFTYEGSKEGRLANALMECRCENPVVHFDEVDKVSGTERGAEIISTLIHLVDPTQNASLRDRYLHSIDLNFSKCTFVFSYNDPSKVSPVLLDRLQRVAMPPPSAEEQRAVVLQHFVPRAQKRLGTDMQLSEGAIAVALRAGGMREVERAVEYLMADAQLSVAMGCKDVLDAAGCVRARDIARATSEAPAPPPPGMYL